MPTYESFRGEVKTFPLSADDQSFLLGMRSDVLGEDVAGAVSDQARLVVAQEHLDQLVRQRIPPPRREAALNLIGMLIGDVLASKLNLEWRRCSLNGISTLCVAGETPDRTVMFLPLHILPKRLASGQDRFDLKALVNQLVSAPSRH